MKTAISIPDEVFERGEHLARELSKSRSQLYTEAVDEYVARHNPSTITDRMNLVIDALDGDEVDDFVTESARRVLGDLEW
ncbi:MAG: ribbon-helix-helix domain-containing protein [Thermoanaerobaculia bacterium]|nr:ribbon-helix-helix domain-containing protein [Thermoanaerobaculia bacterium]